MSGPGAEMLVKTGKAGIESGFDKDAMAGAALQSVADEGGFTGVGAGMIHLKHCEAENWNEYQYARRLHRSNPQPPS